MNPYLVIGICVFIFVLWCGIFLYCVSQAGAWMHRKK